MRKKGYLLLEILLYLSIASLLLIAVMNLSCLINKAYRNEMRNKDKELALIDFDLHFNGALKSYNILDIKCYYSTIDIYYREIESKIYRERFSTVGTSIYKRYYEYKNDGQLIKADDEWILVENVSKFNLFEKENLIYIDIEFKDGYKENFVYEK